MSDYEVYGLYTLSESGEKQYFYVGRTERGVEKRLMEHRFKVTKGHTDVYAYLRELEALGKSYRADVLRTCSGDEYKHDAERWEVIRLLREGHKLQNMRYGDRLARDEIARQVKTLWIRSVRDVATAKSIAAKLRVKRKSRQVQRRELEKMLKEGIPSVRQCLLISEPVRRRLIYPHSDLEIGAKSLIDLKELMKKARQYKALDSLRGKSRRRDSAMRFEARWLYAPEPLAGGLHRTCSANSGATETCAPAQCSQSHRANWHLARD